MVERRCCFVDKNKKKQKPYNVSLKAYEYSSLTHTNNQKLRETSINKQHFTFFSFFDRITTNVIKNLIKN